MQATQSNTEPNYSIAVLPPKNPPQPIASVGSLKPETTLNSTIKSFGGFVPPVLSPFKTVKVGEKVCHESIR